MRVIVSVAPPPVVTLAEAKEHLEVQDNERDNLIKGMVAAASAHLDGPDGWLGRALGKQTLVAYLPAPTFDRYIDLPFPPVVEIDSIAARQGREWVTVDPTVYELRGNSVAQAFPGAWPAWACDPEAVRVTYRAGYDAVPPAAKAAILLMVGDLYRFRDTVAPIATASVPMSTTVTNLLMPLQVYR